MPSIKLHLSLSSSFSLFLIHTHSCMVCVCTCVPHSSFRSLPSVFHVAHSILFLCLSFTLSVASDLIRSTTHLFLLLLSLLLLLLLHSFCVIVFMNFMQVLRNLCAPAGGVSTGSQRMHANLLLFMELKTTARTI